MVGVQCLPTTTFVAFVSMPLLTELDSAVDGFCYRHGAPNGAVPKPAPPSAENSEDDRERLGNLCREQGVARLDLFGSALVRH